MADFTPHQEEALRDEHAHRRLGFSNEELAGWLRRANLIPGEPVYLHGEPLTVGLWPAHRPANDEAALERRATA